MDSNSPRRCARVLEKTARMHPTNVLEMRRLFGTPRNIHLGDTRQNASHSRWRRRNRDRCTNPAGFLSPSSDRRVRRVVSLVTST